MSFSEFTKQKVEKEERITSKGMTEEEVRKRYDELKSMDNGQLTATLFEEVAKQKREGTFDYNSLVQSVENIKGFIPQKTYNELKNLLENLR